MTIMKNLLIISLFLILEHTSIAQLRSTPKKLKAKGEYIHIFTNTVFPEQIETYKRQDIYSFDKKDSNVGITYENQEINKKTTFSVYIYPAGEGSEGRLRNEYLTSLKSSFEGTYTSQFAIKNVGKKYICNGFKAILKTESDKFSQLSLFECGVWFIKIHLTTNNLDSTFISNLEKSILDNFNPSKLTELKPLESKAAVYMGKAAFRDSVMLGSVMGSAFKKLDWAIKNVKEEEKASGFPDMYLDMHIEALKELISFNKKTNTRQNPLTIEYLKEVKSIIDAGFLEEFIMKQYSMVMIIPDNIKFDFEEFEKWKMNKNLMIDLNERYYMLAYQPR
jgi:hypothetical protein